MISSASMAPVKPWASPSRSPAKISPLPAGITIFQIRCHRCRQEGVAHLEQRSGGVGDPPVGVEHDDRRAEQDDREHLGGEADAVDERDQRDDRRRRRRLQHDEHGQPEPLGPRRQAHDEPGQHAADRGERARRRSAARRSRRRRSANVPSASISPNAASVSLNVGKAMLTGTLPAHSHRPSTNRIERRAGPRAARPGRHAPGAVTRAGRDAAGSALDRRGHLSYPSPRPCSARPRSGRGSRSPRP